MSTGYTAPVEDGKVNTLGELLQTVASAFIFGMRELPIGAPIPEYPPLSPRYQEEVDEAQAEVDSLLDLTHEEKAIRAREYNEKQVDAQRESIEWRQKNNEPFLKMKAKVVIWAAPEELANVKEFMIQQLESSCYNSRPSDFEPIRMLSPEEWYEQEMGRALDLLNRRKQYFAEQVERHEKGRKWSKVLTDEIERLRAQESVSA